jgi:F-type H+-transporting ATPase subunit epsilon
MADAHGQTSSPLIAHVQCVVVTPERAVLDEKVDFVALPMYDGELGVAPGRAALIGRLGYGELRTRRGDTVHRYFIDGGFAQVRSNVVTVLTPRAIPADHIDEATATRALETAKTPALTPDRQAEQEKAQQRARAQIRIAQRRAGGGGGAAAH